MTPEQLNKLQFLIPIKHIILPILCLMKKSLLMSPNHLKSITNLNWEASSSGITDYLTCRTAENSSITYDFKYRLFIIYLKTTCPVFTTRRIDIPFSEASFWEKILSEPNIDALVNFI